MPKPSTRVYKSEKANARPKNLLADWFYVKTDHASKDVFLFDGFGANNFLIKDNYNLTWVISEEVKTVAGYECIKATTNFRALEWEVWFAPEIPLSYGPWKLHGLPGLIMEAHDKNRMFNLSVEKIEYKRSDIFDKPFNTLVETRNKEPILLKDFIEQQDEFYENADAKLNQQLPNSITTPHRRVGYELIYEWEE